MIWAKTDAGRAEMQAKALIKERAQRILLLLIDGQKSEEMLLSHVAGIAPKDFAALQDLGLIEPVAAAAARAAGARPAPSVAAPAASPAAAAPAAASTESAPLAAPAGEPSDYARFTETLTRLISKELGLRGFTLTLAVEKAGTIQELMDVARRAVEQIRARKGIAAADAAQRALYGD